MPSKSHTPADGFDQYAKSYDSALNQGLSLTGESREYFAIQRVAWLAKYFQKAGGSPKRVLDYGCGTGSTTVLLLEMLRVASVIGVDTSLASLEQAKKHSVSGCQFVPNSHYHPAEEMDLVYCNGVFHHIPPAKRAAEMEYIRNCLRPGGLFALWENNPWNPGTQFVMSRIPFDRDAVKLSPIESRRLLRATGLEIVATDFLFFLPNLLRFLRPLEPAISWVPLGGQYLVLSRRPHSRT